MTDLSRRHLIQGAVAAGAALAGSTVAVASPKQKWDEVVDVVVIGSGFAGLAAAIEAKKAGANVVVLEKMATFGGNSIINGGILTATGCPQQKLHKIEDSVELLEKDILTAGNYMNYSSKVRYLAEHALSNYEWTVKELGVQYLPDAIGQEGGHSVPVSYTHLDVYKRQAKDRPELAAELNAALKALKENGEFDKLMMKWFGKAK